MAENAIVKILTALLKHQVKKVVGDEALGVIGQEIAAIGGDKVDDQIKSWLGEKTNAEELEKAAQSAHDCFHDTVVDHELEQWMISLPIGDLPKVTEALEKLPTSPNEKQLESALRESIANSWKKLSSEQVDNAVNSFLSCLRSALLPIEKQTLMVIGRSVLRTEDKVDLLLRWFEQYIITGKPVEIKQLHPEPVDYWNLKHPYAMPPNFTGRVEERKMLVDWLNNDNENRLFILRALGGFGKSALSWHWLIHDVDSTQWTKVLWWSFYEGDARFEHFIEETLKYLKLEVPQGQRPQVDELLKAMQFQKILLIMDGFERALRAYSSMNAAYQGDSELPSPLGGGAGGGVGSEGATDCVNINAEWFLKGVCARPGFKSKVLMTTRLTPRAVKPRGEFMLGCREVELTAMQKADAVEFFRKQKINGTHAEIEAACAPYGYHPLSLRLLAGRILKDFENPADIVVAQKLKFDGNIVQQKHHVLEVAYNSLLHYDQKLLSVIACFRSSVSLETLRVFAENRDSLDNGLHDLFDRGLLYLDEKNKKFDLHPIVRRYAYQHLANKEKIHDELARYFGMLTGYKDTRGLPPMLRNSWGVGQSQVKSMEELKPTIELYYHMLNAGKHDDALEILMRRLVPVPLHYQFGAYQLIIELLSPLVYGKENEPHLQSIMNIGWVFNALATAYNMSGQTRLAVNFSGMSVEFAEKFYNYQNAALGLGNLAFQQIHIGSLRDAASSLQKIFGLQDKIRERSGREVVELIESIASERSGIIWAYMGEWDRSKQSFQVSSHLLKHLHETQSLGLLIGYQAWLALIMIRAKAIVPSDEPSSPLSFAMSALKLAEETAQNPKFVYPKRSFMKAHWLLGASNRHENHLEKVESHLTEALKLCRELNAIIDESDILLDLARLRYDQKNYEEAKSLADEALLITERCGYVLQGADVNLFLAQYALEQEKDNAKAKEYAEEAKKLATCDGPPYYYKVAYEEAERMLKALD